MKFRPKRCFRDFVFSWPVKAPIVYPKPLRDTCTFLWLVADADVGVTASRAWRQLSSPHDWLSPTDVKAVH
jgi:hypothetical protein